jgi:hypothetical protein
MESAVTVRAMAYLDAKNAVGVAEERRIHQW